MISGWISVPLEGETLDLILPEPFEAIYRDRDAIGEPSAMLLVTRGLATADLNHFHRTLEVTLRKLQMYDIVLVDRIE